MHSASKADERWRPLAAVAAAVLLLYPAFVFLAARSATPTLIASVLAVALALRGAAAPPGSLWHRTRLALVAAGVILIAVSALTDDLLPVLYYPVAANAVAAALFSGSLWFGPPLVERIARLTDGELPSAAITYTRRVTQLWAVFLCANTIIAAATAIAATGTTPDSAAFARWALWNGLLSYLAMATLFGAEWLVRRRARASWAMQ